MAEKYYCPHSETCPIYENWAETKGHLLGVIVRSPTSPDYECIALVAARDNIYSGGIPLSEELRRRVVNNRSLDDLGCSHILMLSLLEKTKKSSF